MEFRLEFAQRLQVARIGAGYAEPADLAAKLGMKANTYGRYENQDPTENRKFPPHRIADLCIATGYSSWFFLTGQLAEPKHKPPPAPSAKSHNTG